MDLSHHYSRKETEAKPKTTDPSLTPITSKLLEHIFTVGHLERLNILNDAQHGFCKRRSTETQLILTIQHLAKGLDDGQIDALVLNFSKASESDKVPHKYPQHKLDYYGTRGSTLSWIKSFLRDRTQQVLCESKKIPVFQCSQPCAAGHSPGTIAIPYIHQRHTKLSLVNNRLYADDALMYRRITDDTVECALQDDLDNLQEWEKTWLMQFNPENVRCYGLLRNRNLELLNTPTEYSIHNQELKLKL